MKLQLGKLGRSGKLGSLGVLVFLGALLWLLGINVFPASDIDVAWKETVWGLFGLQIGGIILGFGVAGWLLGKLRTDWRRP